MCPHLSRALWDGLAHGAQPKGSPHPSYTTGNGPALTECRCKVLQGLQMAVFQREESFNNDPEKSH